MKTLDEIKDEGHWGGVLLLLFLDYWHSFFILRYEFCKQRIKNVILSVRLGEI